MALSPSRSSESPAAELSSPSVRGLLAQVRARDHRCDACAAEFLEAQPRASRVAALATTRALEPMPSLVARDCRVELAAPTLQRGAAVGDINGVETHCLCCKFGDCSTIFFTQNGGLTDDYRERVENENAHVYESIDRRLARRPLPVATAEAPADADGALQADASALPPPPPSSGPPQEGPKPGCAPAKCGNC